MDVTHLGHETVEMIAAAILAIGGAAFLVLAYRTRPARNGPAVSLVMTPAGRGAGAAPPVARSLVEIMAGLSFGAAFIHLAAAPSHYVELGDLGAGFVVAAVLQGWWGVRARGGLTPRLVRLGIALNVAILVAWVLTRTIGLPVGPFAGGAEPVGYPDAACAAFEVVLLALLAVRTAGLDRRIDVAPVARSLASIAVVPTLGLVIVLTSLATVAIADGLDHGAPAGGVPVGHHH